MPVWGGQRYNEDWHPIGDYGEILGEKDWAANAAWAASTGGQNPYTNQPGSSPYDSSGLIPGNEPGSSLPPVPQAQPKGSVSNTSPAAPSTPAVQAQPDRLTTNVQNAINDALEQGPVVDESDPSFIAQDQANKIQSQRAAERARMSAVQRMHAQGQGDSGAMDGVISQLDQQRGETDQRLNAALRMNFLESERQRYAQALQLGAGVMSGREEQMLRQRLADIQAQLAREDLTFRREYSYDALGQNLGLSLAELQQRAMDSFFR